MVWYGMVCYGMVCYGKVWYGMVVWYDMIYYHMSRATSGEIARSDWLICRAIFSCNTRVLDYGKMTGETSKRGRFESASWEKKTTNQHNGRIQRR